MENVLRKMNVKPPLLSQSSERGNCLFFFLNFKSVFSLFSWLAILHKYGKQWHHIRQQCALTQWWKSCCACCPWDSRCLQDLFTLQESAVIIFSVIALKLLDHFWCEKLYIRSSSAAAMATVLPLTTKFAICVTVKDRCFCCLPGGCYSIISGDWNVLLLIQPSLVGTVILFNNAAHTVAGLVSHRKLLLLCQEF